jgi:putative transposase
VLTDHGSQFCANKRDKKGYAVHKFGLYLKRHHIRHILCRVGHPQTNGKPDCVKTSRIFYKALHRVQ